jgi:microcystin-dependent protein
VPDAYTTGKLGLIEPARGGYVDTWDEPLYANWQTLEAAISGTTTLTLTNANVVLTVPTFPTNNDPPTVSTSCQNLRLYLTGTLAANLTVFIPATVGGFWIIDDATTGSFTVTIKTTAVGSTGIVSIKNKTLIVFSDGTNVKLADSGNTVDDLFLVPSGMISPYGGTSAPTGWLVCDGAAVSRTTYATLFARIGVTWGAGDGSTTFNVPDLANMFLRGSGTSNVGVYEADTFGSHTHGSSLTDPGHRHTTVILADAGSTGQGDNVTGVTGNVYRTQSGALTTTNTTGISISIQATGSSETRPVNKRVLYIIKT